MRSNDDRYGVIVSDLTEPLEDSPSNPLFNEDVFALIKSRLAEGGVYVLQASTAALHNAALHCKMARTLRRHYAHVASFFTHVPAFDTDWAFLACSDRVDLAELDARDIDAYCARLRGENFFLRLGNAPAALLAAALPAPHAGRRRGYVLAVRKAPLLWPSIIRAPRTPGRRRRATSSRCSICSSKGGARQGRDAHAVPPEITNGTGAVHGGAIVSLCDTVFYVALASIFGREQDTTTVALQCNFLAPAVPPHDLIAEARVLSAGRRIVYGEVYVRSGEKIVAHATLNFLNSYPKRNLASEAVRNEATSDG